MSKFYVSRNQQQFGPYTSDQLKQLATSGQITRDDMVLQEGSSQWAAAGCIRGLFSTTQVLLTNPIPTASPLSAGESDSDSPWLSGNDFTSAGSYKSRVSPRKSRKSDNTMPYMIGGGVVAAVLLLLGGMAYLASPINMFNAPPEVRNALEKLTKVSSHSVAEFKRLEIGKEFNRKEFFKEFGTPSQITDFDSDTYFIYNCTDGSVRIKTIYEHNGTWDPRAETFTLGAVEQNY